ncbi:hypothetical protein LV564_04205 [Komagataeibacter nataicola]|uniref:hypothetical protein n=1 Tax=Komagataeibacter nataicola TaxID=265960 RepID=UPI0011B431AA|nr:hypothetical protein [Komagataeibacter nataicola]WEQ56308.1 hypothetical protein LV564_04205 [Komagataeibacter nataicola]WNM07881.1 hypothetical protein RI056_12810 [Komagataeibacter nataicola]
MPRVILPHEQDGRISCFLADQLGVLFYPPFTMMGIEQDGQIIAGAIFNCFETHDVHATIAGHGWTLRFLRALGWYLFDVLRVERFTGDVPPGNVTI